MKLCWIFCLCFLFLPSSLSRGQEPSLNDTLLQVGDQKISTLDFLEVALDQHREKAFLLLRTVLMEKLLMLEVEKYNIFVKEEEKDGLVVREKELLQKRIEVEFGQAYELKKYLDSQGLTPEQFEEVTRDKVTKQLLLGKLIRFLQSQEDRVEVLYMELTSKKRADQILQQLKKGKSFSKYAQKFSKHPPSQKAGGKLPVLKKSDLGELGEAVFKLDPENNPLSPVLEYNKKFHLFKVLKFYSHSSSKFEELNDSIYASLQQNAVSAAEIDQWLMDALGRHHPEVKDKLLEKSKFLENIWQGAIGKK